MIYFCSQKNRRALVLQHKGLNGIDYLEVLPEDSACGTQLAITFLKPCGDLALVPSQMRITGGAAASQVQVIGISSPSSAAPLVVTAQLNQSGDFSIYTLSLVANSSTCDPPPGLDPRLSTVSFSFKAGCPTVGDCAPNNCCPPDTTPEPDINYLAKDYGGFRQVMLDRMAMVAPAWAETHEADMGIALVEMLAYAADHLSYQQDAVGTEAYLSTARSRISLRRHAKLVDYKIGEGSNARAWVYMKTLKDCLLVPAGTLVFPRVSGYPTVVDPGSPQAAALMAGTLGFTTMQDTALHTEQNSMSIYTWSDFDCCLAPGATRATLEGHLKSLQPGDVVVFQEVMGPTTGDPADANPNHRWAVRLTTVRTEDYTGINHLKDPLTGDCITEISWAAADALPFPICISSTTDAAHGSVFLPAVSLAFGNIVPADHGVWQDQIILGTVAVSQNSPTVIGTGTIFTNTIQAGQWLVFLSDQTGSPYQVSAIINNTQLTLTTAYTGTAYSSTVAAILETLGPVPAAPPPPVLESSCTCNSQNNLTAPLPRYYPELAYSPVTFAYPTAALGIAEVALQEGSADVAWLDPSSSAKVTAGQWLVFASDPCLQAYQVASVSGNTITLAASYAGSTVTSTTATLVDTMPASGFLAPSPSTSRALPQLAVYDEQGLAWSVLDDLLSSDGSQRVCVLEIEYTGSAFLRFGDGEYGMAPETGTNFHVRYRVGNGTAGNVGQDTLAHILPTIADYPTLAAAITQVDNLLPAAGGVDPETMDQIRQQAPFAFQTQLRAVTEADYRAMAQQDNSAIREARGTFRWTGSWYTAFVSVDTYAESGPDAALLAATKSGLNMQRMMGVDLEVEGAVIVGLRIEMNICVDPDDFQGDVEAALLQLFTVGNQCSGQPGLLNPDNFTFGQTIYTSPFVAAAQGVTGVSAATMAVFRRMGDPSIDGAAQGYLTMGRLEIARCDNNPNRLDRGIFCLHMDGGK